MRYLLGVILFLFVVLALPLPDASTLAQSEEVFCGTLTEADCDMLQANILADASLESMTYEFQMVMSVLPDVPDAKPEQFTISSEGAFGYDKADLDTMTDEILNTTIGEVLQLLDDPDALMARIVGYIDRLLVAPDAEMTVEIVLPESAEEPIDSLSVDFMMTDGVIYVTSPLMAMMEMPPGAWLSLDLVEGTHMLVDLLQDPAIMEGFMSAPGGFPVPMQSGMDDEEAQPAMGEDMFQQISAIANAPYWEEMESPEFLAQIMTITRTEDRELDGVTVAVFETQVDMAAMVASAPFQQAWGDIFALFAQDASPEEIEALKPVILDMIAGMEITVVQSIGLEDHFTYSFDLSWQMTFDPQKFVEAVSPDELANIPEDELVAQEQSFVFHQEIRDHNQPVMVTPPPMEQIIPLLTLLMGGPPA
jgi:hypothetical protein